METFIKISNFLLFGLIIISPIILLVILKRLKINRVLLIYALLGVIVLGVIIWIATWWSDKSDMILLEHYGYNYDGWNDSERFKNVAQANLGKVKMLERSIMGIGWPLKAIFGFVLTIPYLTFVYLGNMAITRVKNNKNEA